MYKSADSVISVWLSLRLSSNSNTKSESIAELGTSHHSLEYDIRPKLCIRSRTFEYKYKLEHINVDSMQSRHIVYVFNSYIIISAQTDIYTVCTISLDSPDMNMSVGPLAWFNLSTYQSLEHNMLRFTYQVQFQALSSVRLSTAVAPYTYIPFAYRMT